MTVETEPGERRTWQKPAETEEQNRSVQAKGGSERRVTQTVNQRTEEEASPEHAGADRRIVRQSFWFVGKEVGSDDTTGGGQITVRGEIQNQRLSRQGRETVRDEIQNQRLSRQGRETVRDEIQNQWLSRQGERQLEGGNRINHRSENEKQNRGLARK